MFTQKDFFSLRYACCEHLINEINHSKSNALVHRQLQLHDFFFLILGSNHPNRSLDITDIKPQDTKRRLTAPPRPNPLVELTALCSPSRTHGRDGRQRANECRGEGREGEKDWRVEEKRRNWA